MPDWATNVTTVATTVIALSAIATGIVGYRQWQAIRGQLRAMENDQRPWVVQPTIEPIKSSDGASAHMTYTFQNIGKRPTKGLYVGAKVSSDSEVSSGAKEICEQGHKAIKGDKNNSSRSILPQGTFTIGEAPPHIATTVSLTELQKGSVMIAGCVCYGADDSEHHDTSLFAEVSTNKDGHVEVGPVYALDPHLIVREAGERDIVRNQR